MEKHISFNIIVFFEKTLQFYPFSRRSGIETYIDATTITTNIVKFI